MKGAGVVSGINLRSPVGLPAEPDQEQRWCHPAGVAGVVTSDRAISQRRAGW